MKKIFVVIIAVIILVTFVGCSQKKPNKINIADKYLNMNGFKSDITVMFGEKEICSFNFNCTKDEYTAIITQPELLKNITICEKNNTQTISYSNLKLDLNLLSENQKSVIDMFCLKTGIVYEMLINSKIKNVEDLYVLDYKGLKITFDSNCKIVEISKDEYTAKFTNFEFLEKK